MLVQNNTNDKLVVYIYTITNWRVSLSKICHEWPHNAVTNECTQRMSELQRYLVMSYSIYYIDKKKCFESNLI